MHNLEKDTKNNTQSKAMAYTKIASLSTVFGAATVLLGDLVLAIPAAMAGTYFLVKYTDREGAKANVSSKKVSTAAVGSICAGALLAGTYLYFTSPEDTDVNTIEDKPAITTQLEQRKPQNIKLA